MTSYSPRFGTDTYKLVKYLVENAPYGGDRWVLTKTLAECVGLASQSGVHSLLAATSHRKIVVREMVDERVRWQAGPEAADAIKRSAETQPLSPIGFPNAKERQPVQFEPREGGAMDRAIKFLKQMDPQVESIAEADLCAALQLPPDSDLKTQFRPAVEAGALSWMTVNDGPTLVRRWSLGDGFPPHKETMAPPRGYQLKPRKSVAPAATEPPAVAPAAPAAPAAPDVELASLQQGPRGHGMAFRSAFFTDGTVTIQKGHGAVELSAEEALLLFEHLVPWAQAQGRSRLASGMATS